MDASFLFSSFSVSSSSFFFFFVIIKNIDWYACHAAQAMKWEKQSKSSDSIQQQWNIMKFILSLSLVLVFYWLMCRLSPPLSQLNVCTWRCLSFTVKDDIVNSVSLVLSVRNQISHTRTNGKQEIINYLTNWDQLRVQGESKQSARVFCKNTNTLVHTHT